MSKAGLVKCPYCKERDSKEVMIKIGNRYWHQSCRDIYEQKMEEQKTEELKNKERDAKEYKELIAYICELYNIEKPTGMILKQVRDFHNEPYNWRYQAIQLALEYFFEIKENSTANARGIGIVPYIYDEAVGFWKHVVSINTNEDVKHTESQTLKIKRQNKQNKRNKHKFDLDNI